MKYLFLALLATATSSAIAIPSDNLGNSLGINDALLVFHNGSTQTIKKTDLPSLNLTYSPSIPHPAASAPAMNKIKRSDGDFIIELPDQQFLGWDIAMSTVTYANKADVTLAIMAGQNVANSVTESSGIDLTLVEDFLSYSTSVDYQHSVTSLVSGTVTQTVPADQWGCIVSNPLTNRKRGYVYQGQPGSSTFNYYQADSFDDATFNYGGGQLSWVKGVVTTCLGDKYPLPRCNGDGTLE